MKTSLSVHQIPVIFESSEAQLHEWLRFDFAEFVTESESIDGVTVIHTPREALAIIPKEAKRSFKGPNFTCFDYRQLRWVSYSNKAVVRFEREKEHAEFFSDSVHFVYEKIYLFILSRVGERLDRLGTHRVHALGFGNGEQACFVIGRSGVGKTTLFHELLSYPELRFLADDSPLVDRDGNAHPFPIRIGVPREEYESQYPDASIRSFERELFGVKRVLHPDCIRSRFSSDPVPLSNLVILNRSDQQAPQIRRISKLRMSWFLFRYLIVGEGLAQVREYFLALTLRDIVDKAQIAISRVRVCLRVICQTDCFELISTHDPKESAALLRETVFDLKEGQDEAASAKSHA